MSRYVIDVDVALALAQRGAIIPSHHQLVAPTLLRSQVLSRLYAEVQAGRLSRQEAGRRLDYLRGLRIRLLGDRVLQHAAWQVAEQLGWQDTYQAEYVALTSLQADALVTQDAGLAQAAGKLVTVVSLDDLLGN